MVGNLYFSGGAVTLCLTRLRYYYPGTYHICLDKQKRPDEKFCFQHFGGAFNLPALGSLVICQS